jgi:23S rRNA-/tRNA-specific pseudouridylate synthase
MEKNITMESKLDETNANREEDDSRHGEKDNESVQRKKKRGMKPRSKRNRKQPRSKAHALEDVSYETHVHRLAIDGKPVNDSTVKWLRTVEPYPYSFSTFAKARWLGRTVLDVYATEFGSYPMSYYESAISQGRILVSDQKVDISYVIKNGDVLTHTVHRHEPAVAVYSEHAPYVRVVQETDQVLVVDKPGTLPIHPCGGYNVQSLMNLLEPQYGKLYTIHRLDRLTSGLIILGKTSLVAQECGKAIMNRNCKKAYLARVAGKFPLNCSKDLCLKDMTNAPVNGEWTNFDESDNEAVLIERKRNSHGWWVADSDGTILKDVQLHQVFECQRNEAEWLRSADNEEEETKCRSGFLWFHLACPTRIAKPKDGVCEAGTFETLDNVLYKKTVKSAETSFGVVRYDAATDSTVVVCRPATGRSHQIRLHLQYLGHSIANDPNYGGDTWYGNEGGNEACQMAQGKLDAMQTGNTDIDNNPTEGKAPITAPSAATIDEPATEEEIHQGVSNAVQKDAETIHDFIRRTCVWCARSGSGGTDRSTLEFLIRSSGIWLHALQYTFEGLEGENQSFRASLPSWY